MILGVTDPSRRHGVVCAINTSGDSETTLPLAKGTWYCSHEMAFRAFVSHENTILCACCINHHITATKNISFYCMLHKHHFNKCYNAIIQYIIAESS